MSVPDAPERGVTQPWPTTPGDRPPLSRESTVAWAPKGTSLIDRPGGRYAPSGPSGPPGPPPTPGSVPPGWVAAVAVLGVLLLLAVGALVWPRGGEEATTTTTAAPRTTTTRPATRSTPSTRAPSPTPPTVPPAGPPPSPVEVQAAVDALVPFVEQTRGLTFGTRPPVEVADNPAFDELVRAEFDRHEKVWQQRALLLQVLGVVDPRVDVVALFRANEPVGRMAWYEPQKHTIVVRAQRITAYTREQIVGALTRALDDQRFATDRPQYDDSPDELTWAFAALKEGDGIRVSDQWLATLPPPEQAARDRAVQDAHVGVDLTRLPAAVRELDAFPAEAGPAFAAALTAGGNDPLAAAFAEPPRFTASILHPDRYLAKAPLVPVPPPSVNGRVQSGGVFGELMTTATLADTLASDGAAKAAAGWAGDAYVLYEGQTGAPCVRIAYRASSPAALNDLRQAYSRWAERHEGAEVTVEGETLLVNRCITGARGRSPA
jgi:hypothetical protein